MLEPEMWGMLRMAMLDVRTADDACMIGERIEN
jgi:hypothetical protein